MAQVEEYILSERIIHDQVLEEAARGIETLYGSWAEKKNIEPFAMFWPATAVLDEQGKRISDVCMLELSELPKQEWRNAFVEAVKLTNAYAVLLTEQLEDRVEVYMESVHGSRRWTIPIERHGDVHVLGRQHYEDNVEKLKLLWSPLQSRA